jgi:hypothetical protein
LNGGTTIGTVSLFRYHCITTCFTFNPFHNLAGVPK